MPDHSATPDPDQHVEAFLDAVRLGAADRVRQEIERDPAVANRADDRTGRTPLHAVCGSRWSPTEPARAGGLLAVARLLLDAGASLEARARDGRTPLGCATAAASSGVDNEAIAGLLLERGAVPEDGDLYLAEFAPSPHGYLRLLLDHTPDVAGIARTALSAPISMRDTEGCRLLLEAGADPRRYMDDPPRPAVYAAVWCACPAELVRLLLDHGADLDAPGPDGRSPYRLAVRQGRTELAELLRHGG